jgi:CheY-like chemotaxis protein
LIFVVVEDRAFIAMIDQAAKAEGAMHRYFQNEDSLLKAFGEELPKLFLLDITVTCLDGPTVVEKLKQSSLTRKVPLIVFGGSIRADLMQDARESGADKVLPKASFRQQLPELIRHYVK